MTYVFDSGPLIDLFRHYYAERFPSLWQKYDEMLAEGSIVSTREVYNEVTEREDRLSDWAKKNREFFHEPSPEELAFVAEIFKVKHFQALIKNKERLLGKPVADPFVIAKAKISGGSVVTTEKKKENAPGIPNVCEHFGIKPLSLEEFMEKENWTF